jgi:Fic family protein
MNRIDADYPHLKFQKCWRLSENTLKNLGRCEAFIRCIGELPVAPEVQRQLRNVSFERGAVATTAIEGNTLTEDELRKVLAGEALPKSREYQAIEVKNALDLMNAIWQKVVVEQVSDLISTKMLCEFNQKIGQNLGKLYDGVPGRIRNDLRHVGSYLAPPPEYVKELLENFCKWLREEFAFLSGRQTLASAIEQAIVAHVFYEWIHPFADGNGRTGRMLEFYILLRAGMPDVTAHVLANHYNKTRSEYAAHFDNARKKRNLSEFLDYAVQGLVDGLSETWDKVQHHTFSMCWREHIFQTFSAYTDYHKIAIFKRRRALALSMPIGKTFTMLELARSSDELAQHYMQKDLRAIKADFNVLVQLKLAEEVEPGQFLATTEKLRSQRLVPRANRIT